MMRKIPIFLISVFFLTSFSWIQNFVQEGTASYYHNKFHGRKTYSGEVYDKNKMTAAHAKLPMGTYLEVRNLKNDSIVVVKVNDRLPTKSRIIDLSRAAAEQLNFIRDGLVKVRIEEIDE